MDINQIKELIKAVEEAGIGEVTVEEAGVKVTVRAKGQLANAAGATGAAGTAGAAGATGTAGAAGTGAVAVTGIADGSGGAAVAGGGASGGAASGETGAVGVVANNRPDHWIAVNSPMVGTFYSAPSPDAPPFVSVGDEVVAGQSLCIIEAMKLMNEVKAEQMSIIREVCIENSQPVEFGTPLFFIEPLSISDTAGEGPTVSG